jgi:hypothetical protein
MIKTRGIVASVTTSLYGRKIEQKISCDPYNLILTRFNTSRDNRFIWSRYLGKDAYVVSSLYGFVGLGFTTNRILFMSYYHRGLS